MKELFANPSFWVFLGVAVQGYFAAKAAQRASADARAADERRFQHELAIKRLELEAKRRREDEEAEEYAARANDAGAQEERMRREPSNTKPGITPGRVLKGESAGTAAEPENAPEGEPEPLRPDTPDLEEYKGQ